MDFKSHPNNINQMPIVYFYILLFISDTKLLGQTSNS